MKGVIIQMGQFNPVHRMHVRIAKDAIQKYPEYQHFMGMAIKTCDKGVNSDDNISERAKLIEAQGLRWNLFESGLFVDVIEACGKTWPGLPIVFPCGEDTMYRFFRDWDKYYSENHPDEYLKRFTDYEEKFKNVIWYVSRRECPESTQYGHLFDMYTEWHDNIERSNLDLDDISSTKIRNGYVPE